MIWLLLSILIYGACAGGLFVVVKKRLTLKEEQTRKEMAAYKKEIELKGNLLWEVSDCFFGFVKKSELSKIEKEAEGVEEEGNTERGRAAVIEAEFHSVERRLRDLEELARELSASKIELDRELEVLREQEELSKKEVETLREQLTTSLSTIEELLKELSHSQKAVETLTGAKAELVETEEKVQFYEDEVSKINTRYMDLKRAYDALDIEYAQLYERQNSL